MIWEILLQERMKAKNKPREGTGIQEVVDPPSIGRLREREVNNQPPDIIPAPVIRASLDLSSWKLKFQAPLRQFKPRKISNQAVIRLRHRKARQFKTRADIKITVPKAIERGRQKRAKIALENIQNADGNL
jgi:hypothetical protein